jgi:hypothetical protein
MNFESITSKLIAVIFAGVGIIIGFISVIAAIALMIIVVATGLVLIAIYISLMPAIFLMGMPAQDTAGKLMEGLNKMLLIFLSFGRFVLSITVPFFEKFKEEFGS